MSKVNTSNNAEAKEQIIKDKRQRTDGYIDKGNDFSNKYLQTYRTAKKIKQIDKEDPESFVIETKQVEDELIDLQAERDSFRDQTDLYTLLGKQARGQTVIVADSNKKPLNNGNEILDISDIPTDATEKRLFYDKLVEDAANEVENRNKKKTEEEAKKKTGLEEYSKEELEAALNKLNNEATPKEGEIKDVK